MEPVALAAVLLTLAVLLWPRRPGAQSLGGPAVRAGAGTPGRRGGGRGRRATARLDGFDGVDGVDGGVLALLDALGPALRAGLPPADALRAVEAAGPPSVAPEAARSGAGAPTPAPTGMPVPPLLADLLAAADGGEDLSLVWRDRATRTATSDLALVASAWALCEQLGAPLAGTVTTVAAVLRRRMEVERRTAAALAGPRASMTVLTALPAAGPLLALLMGLSPLDLYASPAGTASLVLGLLLLMVGRWWGGRLMRPIGVGARAAARAGDGGRGRRA